MREVVRNILFESLVVEATMSFTSILAYSPIMKVKGLAEKFMNENNLIITISYEGRSIVFSGEARELELLKSHIEKETGFYMSGPYYPLPDRPKRS